MNMGIITAPVGRYTPDYKMVLPRSRNASMGPGSVISHHTPLSQPGRSGGFTPNHAVVSPRPTIFDPLKPLY